MTKIKGQGANVDSASGVLAILRCFARDKSLFALAYMSLWPQVYRGRMSIKGEQQARLTALHVRLQAA